MVQISPDQLFTMMGKLQAELMVLREENATLLVREKQWQAQQQAKPANRAERRRKAKES